MIHPYIPTPEDHRSRQEFMVAWADALSHWTLLETELMYIFRVVVDSSDPSISMGIFSDQNSFEKKRRLVKAAFDSRIDMPRHVKSMWTNLKNKELDEIPKRRNELAHWSMMWSSSDGAPLVWYLSDPKLDVGSAQAHSKGIFLSQLIAFRSDFVDCRDKLRDLRYEMERKLYVNLVTYPPDQDRPDDIVKLIEQVRAVENSRCLRGE